MGRKKFVIAAVAVGLLVGIAPAAPAWASSHGSNPHSKLCTFAKAETNTSNKQGTAISNAVESGNWPKAQKLLVSDLAIDSKLEQQAIATLSSAPSKDRAAGKAVLGLNTSEKKVIQSSKNSSQFEAAMDKLEQSPKLNSAETTLNNYFTSVCGPAPSSSSSNSQG